MMGEFKDEVEGLDPHLAEDMERFRTWLQPRTGKTYYKFNNKGERERMYDLVKRYIFATKYRD